MPTFFRLLESAFTDMFGDFPANKANIIGQEEKTVPMTLELYRGFDADLQTLEQDDRFYYLSPRKAEQSQLWFTHRYIRHYDPVDYAKNKGRWFMRYELPVKKHIKFLTWDDGAKSESLPNWWYDKVDPTQDGKFHAGIELPDGWVFSYKTEKFIGCRVNIKIPKAWVVPSSSVGE